MTSLLRMGLSQALRCSKPSSIASVSCVRKNIPIVYLHSGSVSSSSSKKVVTASSPGMLSATEKSAYEIELEKLRESTKYEGFGYFEDEPYLDKIMFHGLFLLLYSGVFIFGMSIISFMPCFKGDDKNWKFRQANMMIDERRAKGVPLVTADFVPPELIESMVPPPGEWEKEWLTNQQTTRPVMTSWFTQDFK